MGICHAPSGRHRLDPGEASRPTASTLVAIEAGNGTGSAHAAADGASIEAAAATANPVIAFSTI
ncbi:hypothetical protein ACWDBF_23395 [Streptomyces angustmyceticus]